MTYDCDCVQCASLRGPFAPKNPAPYLHLSACFQIKSHLWCVIPLKVSRICSFQWLFKRDVRNCTVPFILTNLTEHLLYSLPVHHSCSCVILKLKEMILSNRSDLLQCYSLPSSSSTSIFFERVIINFMTLLSIVCKINLICYGHMKPS